MRETELFAVARGLNIVSNAIYKRQVTCFNEWKNTCSLVNWLSTPQNRVKSSGNDAKDEFHNDITKDSKSDLRPDISKFEEHLRQSGKLEPFSSNNNQHRKLSTSHNSRFILFTQRRYLSNESSVPASKIGRLANYGQLAAGLAMGSVGEITSRFLDPNSTDKEPKSIVLSKDNIERIVTTLCKIRGAALKLGQMLSIQDDALVSKDVQAIFERVRQSADFMPLWQMEKQINDSLGPNWKDLLSEFNPKPFAAASIGQVHEGVLKSNGKKVAIKVQYPGVAESIDSDIDLLMAVLKYTNIIPRGLYLEEALNVAKKELSWECDYKREAAALNKFKKALKDFDDVEVPAVIPELTSSRVITTELVSGVAVDRCVDLDQETRNRVALTVLKLCLIELFELQFMQTDPNFANFLFDAESGKLNLIDFGSSRSFDVEWVRNYMEVIKCAVDNDKQGVVDYSVKLGFLSGYETAAFTDAHCEAVLVLGEAFRTDGPFDFGTQGTTRKIMNLVPTMVQHRLTPPPEETYSLHRKMSGAFLLCSKLDAKIQCNHMFENLYKKYKSGEILVEN